MATANEVVFEKVLRECTASWEESIIQCEEQLRKQKEILARLKAAVQETKKPVVQSDVPSSSDKNPKMETPLQKHPVQEVVVPTSFYGQTMGGKVRHADGSWSWHFRN